MFRFSKKIQKKIEKPTQNRRNPHRTEEKYKNRKNQGKLVREGSRTFPTPE
jgi:hypothetical protein